MAALASYRACNVLSSATARCPLTVVLPRSYRSRVCLGPLYQARPAQRALVCKASAAQPGGSDPAPRHAVLHDFCMTIPYGGISVVAGIAMFFLNLTNLAGTALVAGATLLAASMLSLQEWKNGGSSTLYTLTSAASAGFVAYTTATSLELLKGLPYWLALALCAFSAAAAAFCLYNVVAGGNPPPKGGKGGKAAP